MSLTYGIESLAVINKGGGLRRLAAGQTTQYLRGGDMTWTDFPTTMTPKAHNHAAGDINSGTLDLVRLPRIAAGSIYVGAGTSNNILTLAKGSALQALRTNADGAALEWYTTPWKDGIGSGAIMTKNATAAGLCSGDEAKPYVFFTGIVGNSFKSGGLSGTDQSWAVIPPNTNYTYAYRGVEYAYNNTSSNYIFLAIIFSPDFIGSTTSPFNSIRLVANGGKSVLSAGLTITNVSNITGNAYSIFASAGTTEPTGIDYTQAVTIYAFFKTTDVNYTGQSSVASGQTSVASGFFSVASGVNSVASGPYSLASGARSVASGQNSVASGVYSVASGQNSVASGAYSVASGNDSVALGARTIAGGSNQTVIGKWNIATTDAFIIGNGTNEASRANCMTVDFNGNMTLSGDLTIPTKAGLDRLAYFDSSGTLQSSASYTLLDFALADHEHLIPNLFCGVPNIVPGRILISGEGGSSNPVWLDVGTNGKILGWTSGAPAWVDVPDHNHDLEYAALSHTHNYAGSSSAGGDATSALACTGNAATATKLASAVTLTIGSTGKSFDGSTSVSWSLADIGASPSLHNHDTAYLQLTGGTMTGDLTLAAGTKFKNLNTGWNSSKIPYFVSGEMVVGTITIDSFADATHYHSTADLISGTLGVASGGTGKSSLTAHAILLGGTTSTGALQQMSLGSERQVLASGGASAIPQWLNADEYERFSVGGTEEVSATAITAKTGISEKLVFIDPGAETTPQAESYFKAPPAANQAYGDRIVIYCCSGNETYKYIVLPNGTEKFCDLIGGQYTGNIEASYGNKVELVCLPKSGAKAWYVSRIALINNN